MTSTLSRSSYGGLSLQSPLKSQIDQWNLDRSVDAGRIAIDVLMTPEIKEVCGEQSYQAILGGYVISTDIWQSKMYRALEEAKRSENGDLRAEAESVSALARTIVEDHYGEKLPTKIDAFALAHQRAYESDGHGKFWKRQAWFVRDTMGNALGTLQQYGVPADLTP